MQNSFKKSCIIFLRRRLDGTSYNKENVFWGSAMENVARDVPAVYADGVAMPAGTCSSEQKQSGNCRYVDAVSGFGSQRPSPRTISNELFRQVRAYFITLSKKCCKF